MLTLKNKIKYWITATLIIPACYAGYDLLYNPIVDQSTKTDINNIRIDLKLKTDKSNIINAEIFPEKGASTIKYSYNSKVESPAETIKFGTTTINEDLTKRTKNTEFFKLPEKDKWQAKIYAGDSFIKDADGKFKFIEYATTTKDAYDLQTIPDIISIFKKYILGEALATDYYSSTGDGQCLNSGATWATVRSASTAGSCDSTAAAIDSAQVANVSGTYYIRRAYFYFDTSAIGSESTVTSVSASFSVFKNPSGASYTHIVTHTADDPITTSKFGNISFTSLGSLLNTTLTVSATPGTYNTWADSDINSVNKTGVTKIALINSYDQSNTTPGNGVNDNIGVSTSDTTGTSNDPYLSVIYTTPSSASVPTVSPPLFFDN